MKNIIIECIQISLIILSVAIGIALPNISILPVGDDSNFVQTFSEKPHLSEGP